MYFNISFLTFCFFIPYFTQAQAPQKLLEFPIYLHTGSIVSANKSEVFAAKDKDNQVVLFLIDKKDFYAVSIDKDFQLKNQIDLQKPDSPLYKKILGGLYKDDRCVLFYTGSKEKQFTALSVDFLTGKSTTSRTLLKLEKEKFIDAFVYNEIFYLLTLTDRSNNIKVYSFTSRQEPEATSYNFSELISMDLHEYLRKGFGSDIDVQRIDPEAENNLSTTFAKNKLYYFDNKIYLTIDAPNGTGIITLDLITKQPDYRKITPASLKSSITTHNSFIFRHILFQAAANADEMKIKASVFPEGTAIREFSVERGDDISFANTPIIQEGGGTAYAANTIRELSKTRQLLRKISASSVAISVCENRKQDLQMTVGSYKELNGGGGGMGGGMPMGGGSISTPYGPASLPTYYTAPSYYAFQNNKLTKSAYFKSVFENKSLLHKEGEVEQTIYEKIENYEKMNEGKTTTETLFRMHNYFVYGYYDKSTKKYVMMKFE
jgi:hypothetical protein